jgi:hypothetical protein
MMVGLVKHVMKKNVNLIAIIEEYAKMVYVYAKLINLLVNFVKSTSAQIIAVTTVIKVFASANLDFEVKTALKHFVQIIAMVKENVKKINVNASLDFTELIAQLKNALKIAHIMENALTDYVIVNLDFQVKPANNKIVLINVVIMEYVIN